MDAPALLDLHVPDTHCLYLAYMPFLTAGGLFVPTNDCYELGDEVFLRLQLPGTEKPVAVTGRVVWITPARAQGEWQQGIGLEFLERQPNLKLRIEALLAEVVNTSGRTLTL